MDNPSPPEPDSTRTVGASESSSSLLSELPKDSDASHSIQQLVDAKPQALAKQASSATNNSEPDSKTLSVKNPWAPLMIPMYRSFWVAGLISNLGTWVHETGAVWLMTSLEPRPEMVSAVRTCMTIPVFCLALPAGVWADRFDRRTWLLSTQLLLLVIAALMAALSAVGMITPIVLLVLTAAMGIGMILNQPAWQALTPELVPPALVPSAVSVGSISFNLARSLGPALAGLLISRFDVWIAFALNAFSFLGIVVVLLVWKSSESQQDEKKNSKKSPPRFYDELRKGMFLVKNSPAIKHTMMRVFIFAIPATIIWSLLSLVVTEKLGYAERGFGLCLGLLGCGAVIGAWFLPWLRTKLSSETIVLAAQLGFGLICLWIGSNNSPVRLLPSLLLMGSCWMATMTTLNATAQVNLPRKFRARGMATYIMCFALGMAIGSLTWGWLAYYIGISWTFIAAGITMAILCTLMHRFKLGELVSA